MSYAMNIITFSIPSVRSKDEQIIIKVGRCVHEQKYEKVDIDCYLQEVCEEISVWPNIAMDSGVHCQE